MGFKHQFTDLFCSRPVVPSSIDMRDGTRVKVSVNGKVHYGEFRGPAPDGSYSVLVDGDNKKLMAFQDVEPV